MEEAYGESIGISRSILSSILIMACSMHHQGVA